MEAVQVRMTRSHKLNNRDHGVGDPSGGPESQLPRYFAKSGPVDANPTKTKKDGGGKGNWGRDGDELQDTAYNLTNPRRRSNSSASHPPDHFKTKFETNDQEPVFEEELHGPIVAPRAAAVDGADDVSNESTTSTSGGSVEENDHDAAAATAASGKKI